MFAPKITSSAEQLRKRAGVVARLVEIRSTRVLVSYGAPMFARGLAQRARDRVADLVGHLRAAGRVEKDEAAVAQRREASAHGLDVE